MRDFMLTIETATDQDGCPAYVLQGYLNRTPIVCSKFYYTVSDCLYDIGNFEAMMAELYEIDTLSDTFKVKINMEI